MSPLFIVYLDNLFKPSHPHVSFFYISCFFPVCCVRSLWYALLHLLDLEFTFLMC